VFIHGLGGSSLNWTDLMAALQPDVDGYAIDLGGFGQSPPPRDGDMTPAGHAAGVVEFIVEELGGEPVHVFGNSLGGAVALQLAARRPDLARADGQLHLFRHQRDRLAQRRRLARGPALRVGIEYCGVQAEGTGGMTGWRVGRR
jgi:pimeloyl-ACP methyl ester carboxylesterase